MEYVSCRRIMFWNFNFNFLWILLYVVRTLSRIRGLQRDVVYLGWPIEPSYISPNAGGEGCGVSANEYSCPHGAQKNFRDLTPYLTSAQDASCVDKTDQSQVTCERGAPLVRCYLAGWGLPALAAGITAAATLSPSSNLGSVTPLGNGANKSHSFADFSYYFSRHLRNGAKTARLNISRISLFSDWGAPGRLVPDEPGRRVRGGAPPPPAARPRPHPSQYLLPHPGFSLLQV